MGDLARVARAYRIINIDADPDSGNFTREQLATLAAGGRNRVLSYFNVGACEHFRAYWSNAPAGLSPCSANKTAQRGAYDGYPDETWMDPGDAAYQKLLLEHVAPRLAARVNGFYLDNLELLEHPAMSSNGPCSPSCRQGGLDFVRKLREKYPTHVIVMQNATSDVTRIGTTGGLPFATLLDGIAHEEVYAPRYDGAAEAELLAWKAMALTTRSGRPFWIAVEDYAGSCSNKGVARTALAKARARQFSPYVSDESGGQRTVCYWE
jgi:cysteinyl-tRNA synthetase